MASAECFHYRLNQRLHMSVTDLGQMSSTPVPLIAQLVMLTVSNLSCLDIKLFLGGGFNQRA